MKVAILTIHRNDRPTFLEHLHYMISQQTVKPDIIEMMDDKPLSDAIDITYRYRVGTERAFKKGADVIIFMEVDDFYSPIYIERMVKAWEQNGKPSLFGINNTTYYNVVNNKYVYLGHAGRASMMSTMISKEANINWGADNYAYTDVVLWKQLKGVAVSLGEPICLGIKHGVGLCGGGGHTLEWAHYNQVDENYQYLSRIVDAKSLEFYKSFKLKQENKYTITKKQYSKNPFLSIVTRKYLRPIGFSANQKSIESLFDKDIEQIFIEDKVGYGLHEANKSFELVKDEIKGEYVFLLDDDDYITNQLMVTELKTIAERTDADVIFFKMHIKNANNCLYPTPNCWGIKPIQGSIGGSCFVVKREIYQKFIQHFGKARMGDFFFINEVFNSGAKVFWYDKKMCETGKVSRGGKE